MGSDLCVDLAGLAYVQQCLELPKLSPVHSSQHMPTCSDGRNSLLELMSGGAFTPLDMFFADLPRACGFRAVGDQASTAKLKPWR